MKKIINVLIIIVIIVLSYLLIKKNNEIQQIKSTIYEFCYQDICYQQTIEDYLNNLD